MHVGRNAVMLAVVVGGLVLVRALQRRAAVSAQRAEARRRVARGGVGGELRADRRGSERWDDEGGAIPAADA